MDEKERAAKKLMGRASHAAQKLFSDGKRADRDKKRAEWYAKNKPKR
jgi:hypothetical protein